MSEGALATQYLAMDVVWPGGLLTSPMQDEQQATGSAEAQGRQQRGERPIQCLGRINLLIGVKSVRG